MSNRIPTHEIFEKAQNEFQMKASAYFQELARAQPKGYLIDKEGKFIKALYSDETQKMIDFLHESIDYIKKSVMDHYGIPYELTETDSN